MSDQNQYGNYMAQQPQPINTSENYNGSGNSQPTPDYAQSSSAGQQQVMYGEEQGHYGEDGYRGYSEYGAQEFYAGSGEKLQPAPPRRRSMRGFWPLLVLVAFVVMMAGAVTSFHDRPGMQFGPGHMMGGMGFGKGSVYSTQMVKLVSGMTPTLIINDQNGSVTIKSSSDNSAITVTTDSQFGNDQRNLPYKFDKQSDTLSIDTTAFGDSNDITVTTPANVNVQVQDGSGDVQLQGISGQVNLTSQDGDISLTNAALQGNSSVTSQGGSITFEGSLDQHGTYNFESVNGDVDLTLPSNTSFHLVNTSGNLNNEFNGSDVGSSPQPPLTVSSQNGNATISKGP